MKYKKHKHWIYAMYKGEEFLTEGTCDEICETMHITKNTFNYYKSKAWKERIKDGNNHRVIIRIDK